MRRARGLALSMLGAGMLIAAPVVLPGHARAAVACPLPLTPLQTVTPSDGGGFSFLLCTGTVPSFDGTPLDTDLAIPSNATGPLPLMVMMHGWGGSKTDWESTTFAGGGTDTWHWNNAWFASRGFTVLTYTARGFHHSCGKDTNYSYATDPACSGKASWTHLSDRRWEIHDTQYLAGLLVDSGVALPEVTVTGGSYGGGQSWLLALSQDQVVDPTSTDPAHPILHPWVSPKGTPLHLVAAMPKYPWTDLVAALQPNGRSSDGFFGAPPAASSGDPIGVMKQSYTAGLYGLGSATAQYAAPQQDPTADLTSWFGGVSAGEPYEANPEAQQALTEIGSQYRSPYAVPVPDRAHQVPVFFFQGHTDPLFPAYQGLEEVNRLLAADPAYPVWGFYGDLGHSYANNPAAMWHEANGLGNAWLGAIMAGTVPAVPHVTVVTTACVSGQTPQTYAADRYQQLATTVLHFSDSSTQQTVSSTAPEPEGLQTDPIANSGCRTISAGSDPGVASYSFPVATASTVMGAAVVHADVTVNGVNAEIASRLWDVDTAGNQTLIARNVYRIEVPSPGTTVPVAFELTENAYSIAAGHTLKLELTQDDSPVWRPDNEPSSLSISNLTLDVPVIQAPAPALPEAPVLPLLIAVALAAAWPARRRFAR